jgi:hypothetical protein
MVGSHRFPLQSPLLMKRLFPLLYFLGALLMFIGFSAFAQMVEAPVAVKV